MGSAATGVSPGEQAAPRSEDPAGEGPQGGASGRCHGGLRSWGCRGPCAGAKPTARRGPRGLRGGSRGCGRCGAWPTGNGGRCFRVRRPGEQPVLDAWDARLHLLWLQLRLAVLTWLPGGPKPRSREGEGCAHPWGHPGCGGARLPGLPGGGTALLWSLPYAGPRAAWCHGAPACSRTCLVGPVPVPSPEPPRAGP